VVIHIKYKNKNNVEHLNSMLGRRNQIEIELEKNSFSPGETIRGRIILKLNKPVHGKELLIIFTGQKINRGLSPTGQLFREVHTCFKKRVQIDSEKEYYDGNMYVFEVEIPEDILEKAKNSEENLFPLGISKRIIKEYESIGRAEWHEEIKWYIEARLKKQWGKTIKKRIKIDIS